MTMRKTPGASIRHDRCRRHRRRVAQRPHPALLFLRPARSREVGPWGRAVDRLATEAEPHEYQRRSGPPPEIRFHGPSALPRAKEHPGQLSEWNLGYRKITAQPSP